MSSFELYSDNSGEYRWRLRATNGKVIATGGEGYKAKRDCEHGIELVRTLSPEAKLKDLTDDTSH